MTSGAAGRLTECELSQLENSLGDASGPQARVEHILVVGQPIWLKHAVDILEVKAQVVVERKLVAS
jgi:hypothetical protein